MFTLSVLFKDRIFFIYVDIFTLAIMRKNAVPGLLAALDFDNFKNKILQSCVRI